MTYEIVSSISHIYIHIIVVRKLALKHGSNNYPMTIYFNFHSMYQRCNVQCLFFVQCSERKNASTNSHLVEKENKSGKKATFYMQYSFEWKINVDKYKAKQKQPLLGLNTIWWPIILTYDFRFEVYFVILTLQMVNAFTERMSVYELYVCVCVCVVMFVCYNATPDCGFALFCITCINIQCNTFLVFTD